MSLQSKKEFKVVIGADDEPTLLGGPRLATLPETNSYFAIRGYRHPLAIYNISLNRISTRGCRFANFLYQFFSRMHSLEDDFDEIRERIDEQLELLVYALDAHIDDCELILKLCFKSDRDYAKSHAVKKFKEELKPIRRQTSLLCNALKHNHQRIRFFESEFFTARSKLILLGFFLERASKDGIHPDPDFLGPHKKIISCVGFLWSRIIGIMQISLALNTALSLITDDQATQNENYKWNEDKFKQLIMAAALLPLYTFDDDNPFRASGLRLVHDAAVSNPPLVGSFLDPITARSELLGIGSWRLRYEGDGITRVFNIAIPTRASFHCIRRM
jgi:hypothetical protein